MSATKLNKELWVEMFREIGLSDESMIQWHRIFEKNCPDDHQEFLEWLNIPKEEITQIRTL